MSYIRVKNLTYSYKIFKKKSGFLNNFKDFFKRKYMLKKVLNNISFDIDKGEKVGILGPNGAGKSTLIKLLTGIIYTQAGDIQVANFNPDTKNNDFLKKIGVVMGQKSQLNWNLPASDTFKVIKYIYGISDKDYDYRLKKYLNMFNLNSVINIPVRKLSLGERTKLEIIASLLHNPSVLLLDEPTLGMDIVSKHSLYDFINFINETEKVTVILISHQLEDIKEVTKRILILLDGKIKFDGSINEIYKKASLPKPKIIIESKKGNPVLDYEKLNLINKENKIIIQSYNDNSVLKINPNEIKNFIVDNPSLEEYIYNLFSKEGA